MRNLLLLTALMVSAIPLKADDTRLLHRSTVIGAFAAAECLVSKGEIIEEQAKALMNEYGSENPELNAAYLWALPSDKVSKGLQALVPHLNSDCDDHTVSEDEALRLVGPYLN